LRWLLPATAVLGLVLFAGAGWLRSLVPGVTMGPISLTGGALVMSNPRLTGFDNQRRPYELTADRARQNVSTPRKVELDAMVARINLAANGWLRLTADSGLYDGDNETFRAWGNVHVASTLGYDMLLDDALVNIKAQTLVTEGPVEGRQGENRINAERMSAQEGGAVIVFEGRVRVVYHEKPEDMTQ
jgi:lipopolysaccharide export system protein LptC